MTLFMLAAHSARESQTTTAGFSALFEVGVADHFWKSNSKKEAHSTCSPRVVVWLASRGRRDPDGNDACARLLNHFLVVFRHRRSTN